MDSKSYKRIAEAADENAWEVVAHVTLPNEPGCYPAAICVVRTDYPTFEGKGYIVSMAVLPTDTYNHYGVERLREAFFVDSSYDMTLERALEVFSSRVERKVAMLVA